MMHGRYDKQEPGGVNAGVLLSLRYAGGFTPAEIATLLETSAGTVRVRSTAPMPGLRVTSGLSVEAEATQYLRPTSTSPRYEAEAARGRQKR